MANVAANVARRWKYGNHCSLCGVVITDASHPHRPLGWKGRVRVLYLGPSQNEAKISGLGFLSNNEMRVDDDANVSYRDPGATLQRRRLSPPFTLQSALLTPPTFGVHENCWILLQARVLPGIALQDPAKLAARLYDVLVCTTGDYHRFLGPNHDQEGAGRNDNDSGERYNQQHGPLTPYRGTIDEPEWEYIYADPLKQSFDTLEMASPPLRPTLARFTQPFNFSNDQDTLTKFPSEIIVAILSELPSPDICNLRLASPAVATVSVPEVLPNAFWQSRFRREFEMGFYVAGNLPALASRDWRLLYDQVQNFLAHPRSHDSLYNRHRIWNSLHPVYSTLEAMQTKETPSQQNSAGADKLAALEVGMTVRVSHQPGSGCPSVSSRFSWDHDIIPHTTENPKNVEIFVSFLPLNGQVLMCGIRAVSSTPTATVTISQAGIVLPARELSFSLQTGHDVTQVRAICSSMGIVGIEFFLEEASGEIDQRGEWQRLGTTNMVQGDGLGVAILTGGKIRGLDLLFDACKCVSIGTLMSHEENNRDSGSTLARIWSPDVPQDSELPSHMLEETYLESSREKGVSKQCFDVNFGGARGERLSLLNRVTPYLNARGLLQGMSFFYDDGTELSFGSRGVFENKPSSTAATEPSLVIRGAAGERIVRIYYMTSRAPDLGATQKSPCFEIETNMALRSPLKASRKVKSFDGYASSVGVPGRAMTRLFAQMESFDGHVKSLDAQHMRDELEAVPMDDENTVVITGEHLDLSWHVHDYYAVSFALGANIGQVRSMHFSQGRPGHCRSRDNITGMLIRFWNSDQTLVLGQWIEPIKDGFIQLQKSEKLIGISIAYYEAWPHSLVPGDGSDSRGRIMGIRLVTSQGRAKRIKIVNEAYLRWIPYLDSPYETITGLLWNFNHQWDFIQVLRAPNPARTGIEILPVGLRRFKYPYDKLDYSRDVHDIAKFFWEETNPKTGVTSRLAAIDAFSCQINDPQDEFHFNRYELVGMRFRYMDGMERAVGRCEMTPRMTIDSVNIGDEEIAYFGRSEVFCLESAPGGLDDEYKMILVIEFTSGRRVTLPARAEGLIAQCSGDSFYLGTEKKSFEGTTPFEGGNWKAKKQPPKSRGCVGLWIQDYEPLHFGPSSAGPLFESDK
ncbi:hypothetical protein B0I35DRAFT_424165 [Stachybotrys elegans]|uniref:F-box domain-containing protein n=1 Tax=Stachybotrys elegans TaxID=80388 RepID=A0A8K0SYU7_9HYPO|nr:hypothetical protein B0I35DRAFT_424165 [Stachybotrys elegans]